MMVRMILSALGLLLCAGMTPDEDIKELDKGLNNSNASKRAVAAEKLGRKAGDAAALDLLLKRLKMESTDGVIVAILDAIKANGSVSKAVAEAAIPRLKTTTWQIALSAAALLSAQKEKEAVTPLIDALKIAEKENNARLMNALNASLASMTGKEMFGAGAWETWWAQNKETFTPGEPQSVEPKSKDTEITTFYEVPVLSSRVIFVIDRSGSMRDKASWVPEKDRTIETGANPAKAERYKKLGIPSAPVGDRKIDVVKYELMRVLADLPDGTMFNIIFYNDRVETINSSLLKMGDSTRKSALDWVRALQPDGATNIFDALEKGFTFAGAKPSPSPEAAQPKKETCVETDLIRGGIDSIYLLSDGIANRGKIQTTTEILAKIREINKVRKIAIHTIAAGNDADEMLMEQLAKENGGKYVKH